MAVVIPPDASVGKLKNLFMEQKHEKGKLNADEKAIISAMVAKAKADSSIFHIPALNTVDDWVPHSCKEETDAIKEAVTACQPF